MGEGLVVEVRASRDMPASAALGLDALTSVERGRALAFARPEDRADFVAAHLLARDCVARLVRVPATAVVLGQACERCGGPHGRPFVVGRPEVFVSWAHSAGHVVAAAAGRPVGADLETREHAVPGGPDEELLRRTGTAAERALVRADPDPRAAFLRLWVLKEALVKVGVMSLDDFAVTDLSPLLARPPDGGGARSWSGFHVLEPAHPAAAVAVVVDQRPARPPAR